MHQRSGKSQRRAGSILTAAVLGALCATPAWADNYFWDENGGSANTGGTGNWTTPSNISNWRIGSTGGALATWLDGNTAVFPASAGTVTVDAPVSATGLTFNATSYVIGAGSTLTLSGATPTIRLNDLNLTGGFISTINAALSASNQVIINKGTGTGVHQLTLNSASNAFSGGIRIDGPTRVNLGASGALGTLATAGTITVAATNTTITTLSGSPSSGTVTVENKFVLNPGALSGFVTGFSATNVGATVDFTGQISGTGDVIVDTNPVNTGPDGDGVTVFSNSTNNWAGSLIIANNTDAVTRIGANGAVPAGAALVFGRSNAAANIGLVDLNGKNVSLSSLSTNLVGTQTAGGITNSNGGAGGTISITGSASTTYTSKIGNVTNTNLDNLGGGTNNLALHLTSAHSGTLTLTGVNDYAGPTTIQGGTLVLAHTIDASNTITSNATVSGTGTLASAGGGQSVISRSGGSVTVNSGGAVSPGTNGGIGTLVADSMSANGGSIFNFDLSTTSNYDVLNITNALTLDAGTQTIDLFGTPTAGGSYTLMNFGSSNIDGATFKFELDTTLPAGFNYTLDQSSGTSVILNVAASAPTLVWDIGGGGTPIVEGAGTWQDGSTDFTNTANNSGATFYNIGTIDGTPTGDPVFSVTFGNSISGTGGAITFSGNVRVGGKLIFGPIDSNNPYQLGLAASTETLTTSASGILTQSSGSIEAPVVMEASQTWTTDSATTLTVNGAVSETGGSATLTKAGAGTVLLGGANTFTGGVNVTAGTLAVANSAGAGTGAIAISNNATLRTTASVDVSNAVTIDSTGGTISVDATFTSTFSGNIGGSGTLTKSAAGTAVLTGTNTFNGLVINGLDSAVAAAAESALGSGSFSISNNAIFRNTGSFTLTKNVSLTNGIGRFDTNGFDLTISGTISGIGALAKEGSGTLVLSASNTFSGNTQFPAVTGGGTIETLHVNALGGAAANNFLVLNNGTLRTTNDLAASAFRGTSVLTKEGAGKLTVSGTSNATNLNAGSSIVVNQGQVQMDSLTGLGGNNNGNGMAITLNSGTELLVNWTAAAGANNGRRSADITVNDATITRLNGATGGLQSEFVSIGAGTGDLQISGSSTIQNLQIVSAGDSAKQLQFNMPVIVSADATLTLSAVNNAGDYHNAVTSVRGAQSGDTNWNITLEPGATVVTSGSGEKWLGAPNTNISQGHGSPIVGKGVPGDEATLKLDAHTRLTDRNAGGALITRLVVAGSADAGLRIEAPMNATYTAPDGGGAPSLRTYDGTTGLFGVNSTATFDTSALPAGYAAIGNAYTVMSPQRTNQLSNVFGSLTLGGTLTLAATDAPSTPQPIDNGPSAAAPIRLALDNTTSSSGLNVIYALDGAANGGKFSNFAGLDVKKTSAGAGSVKVILTSTTRTPNVSVSSAQIDVNDQKLILTDAFEGTWSNSSYTGVLGLVKDGRNSTGTAAPWNGNGLMTSQSNAIGPSILTSLAVATADDIGKVGSTWGGNTLESGDVLVMYTYGGDANLSGKIDADDYFQIDSNYNKSGTVFGYNKGDFNYDGVIDGDDFMIIDANFSGQGTPFSTAPVLGGVAAVPEPAALAILGLPSLLLLARRRQRRRFSS